MARRIAPKKRVGITDLSAPHWIGDTAELTIEKRRATYAAEAIRRQTQRRSKSTSRPLTPQRELTRLRRNLERRKTLAARQRIQRRISELERELEI